MSPTIPSSLDDRYVLDAVVAARGDAVTVTATDEILLRDVWITLLLEFDDERRAAFRQQAEALARRNVEGAPRVYDGSMRAALPYVVTQPAADGDPSALLEVLTDDDAPTAELPIIVKSPSLADTARMAVAVPDRPAPPPPVAAAAPAAPAAGAATRRRMVLAATAGVLLLMAATAAVWATSDSDAPALAEQMPVVQGVDVTEEPTEPEPDPTPEPEPTKPEPAPEVTTEEEAAAAPDPAPAEVGPAAEPEPQAERAPEQKEQKEQKEKKEKKEKSGGQGGPPDHAKAKGRDR